MTAAFLAGLTAGVGVALPIGAVAIYLVSLSARTSTRVGLSAALGAASADGMYAALAVIGGGVLADRIRAVSGPLQVISAGVLLGLALRLAVRAVCEFRTTTTPHVERTSVLGVGRAYLTVLGITLVNPTTVVYFAALIAGRGGSALSMSGRVGFVLGVLTASATCQLGFAASGAVMGRALVGRRAQLVTALLSSAVIGVLAVRIATP